MNAYHPKYWSRKGRYQKRYDAMHSRLVPEIGEAQTDAGEILRLVSRIYYDVFNNGGGNLPGSGFREKLVSLCPKEAKEHARKFGKSSNPRQYSYRNFDAKFMDKFVDWAILYAEALEKAQAASVAIAAVMKAEEK